MRLKYEFLSFYVRKGYKYPMIDIVYPIPKPLPLYRPSLITVSPGRTVWKIHLGHLDFSKRVDDEEVMNIFLTQERLVQWPIPAVKPLIHKLGDSEAMITIVGRETWDSWQGFRGAPLA